MTYASEETAVIQVGPEELVGSQTGFAFSQEGSYSGGGSVAGSGSFAFYVNAPRDGYYKVGSAGNGSCALSKSRVNYAKDAKAESEVTVDWMKLFDLTVGDKNAGMVYLTAGLNQLRLEGSGPALDLLTFTENPQAAEENSVAVEAEDWNVQLKQAGITLEQGCKYRVSFKATSTVGRTIKWAMLSPSYDWYGGHDNALTADEEKAILAEFTMDKETDVSTTLVISMGLIKDENEKRCLFS